MTIQPVTRLSRTRAMMSATALRKVAQDTTASAEILKQEGWDVSVENLRALAEWYMETADALDALDDAGTAIVCADPS